MSKSEHHIHIEEELDAMSDSDKWLEYKKKKLLGVAKRLDISTCEEFADYLNTKMIDAIKANNGDQMYKNWEAANKSTKKQFAQNIVNTFLESIIQDIWNDKVKMYKADGSVYEKRRSFNRDEDEYLDRIWKEDNTKKPNIVITDVSNGLMGCSPTGELVINFDHMLYSSLVVFLMDLRHELDHVVNIFLSSIHPLSLMGADRLTAMRYYVQPEDSAQLYEDNPVEISANLKRKEFAEMCSMVVAGKPWNSPMNTNTPDDREY